MPKRPTNTQEAAVQIQLDIKLSTPSYYVNYVAVSHTPYDFTLSVIKIPSPLTQELADVVKDGKPMLVEPILQIVMPPLLIDGLIKALVDQKAKHEVTLTQQVKNNAAQHQHIKVPSDIQ